MRNVHIKTYQDERWSSLPNVSNIKQKKEQRRYMNIFKSSIRVRKHRQITRERETYPAIADQVIVEVGIRYQQQRTNLSERKQESDGSDQEEQNRKENIPSSVDEKPEE